MKVPAALLLTLVASRGLASPIDIQLSSSVIAGKGKPAVTIAAEVPARRIHLRLKRTGCGPGTKVEQSIERLASGQSHRFELDQPLGHCDYEGVLEAEIGGERAALPLQFGTDVAGPPEVRATAPGFDAKAQTVVVIFNREADQGSVEAYGEGGQRLGLIEKQELGDAPAGDPLTLSFESSGKPVLKLHVTVYDAQGLFAGVDLFPWSLKIPHAEVNFESGSAEIPASELPKVKDSAARIAQALKQVGGLAPLRLFVAGYTDTVGTAEGNELLSSRRAQSIGRFFRSQGIAIPLLTAGLGEQALVVGTPDETPEVRNRRAEYILAVDAPAIENATRQPNWAPLAK